MKKNIFLTSLALLLFAGNNIFSQNITIKGKITNAKSDSGLIRLISFDDMLTYEQTSIFETRSDKDGNFLIEADINDITLAQIAVNLERVDILLKPNSDYEIEIIMPEQGNNASYFERQAPTLKMIEANDNELYYQYYMSESIINNFVYDNFNQLYRARKASLLDSLDAEVLRNLGELKHDFVKDNLRYRKASLQMVINNDNAKKVVNQYYNKKEILHSQAAYMNLFQEIFANYLSSIQFNPSELRQQIYSVPDNFLNYVKKNDAFLADNEDLAEIIIAWDLKRLYYEIPELKKQILGIINTISQNSKNQKNKTIVNNILKQINRLSFNTDAPTFSLKDKDGNIVNSSSFKDDIILLQFVNQVSTMTDYQFNKLKEFSQQWNDTVQIVTIATKECFDDFEQIFKDKRYEWKLLNLGDDILLLEEYQIKTFPDYVILGRNNKIGMAPAPAPEHYLEYHIRRIYNHYKK